MLGAVEWGLCYCLHGCQGYTVRIGQPHHRFQKSLFWSVFTEMQPQSFQTKTGSATFSKFSVFNLENAGVV